MNTVLFLRYPKAFYRTFQPSYHEALIAVPAPIQAGVLPPNVNMEEPWVVHIPEGRWTTGQRIPICPLEHPVFNTGTGEIL